VSRANAARFGLKITGNGIDPDGGTRDPAGIAEYMPWRDQVSSWPFSDPGKFAQETSEDTKNTMLFGMFLRFLRYPLYEIDSEYHGAEAMPLLKTLEAAFAFRHRPRDCPKQTQRGRRRTE
jgi:hypothetical protein